VHLAQAFDRCGQPGKTVGSVLGGIDAASFLNLGPHTGLGKLKDAIRRRDRIAGALKKDVRTRCKYVLLSRERGGRHCGLLWIHFPAGNAPHCHRFGDAG
jgi:hypothetical protein